VEKRESCKDTILGNSIEKTLAQLSWRCCERNFPREKGNGVRNDSNRVHARWVKGLGGTLR